MLRDVLFDDLTRVELLYVLLVLFNIELRLTVLVLRVLVSYWRAIVPREYKLPRLPG